MTADRRPRPFAASVDDVPAESWGREPGVRWWTLVSADRTPSDAIAAGVCEIGPGAELERHRHDEPEVYHFLSGRGRMTIDGGEIEVGAGTTVFVPGGAWHRTVNDGSDRLRLFYCFATASFSDVHYEYPDGTRWQATSDAGAGDTAESSLG